MKKSFTLIELLVVLIIIGILVTVAIPQYNNMVEKSKWAGPVQMLGALRRACVVYHDGYGVYPAGTTDANLAYTSSDPAFDEIGIKNPNPPLPAEPDQFRYWVAYGQYDPDGSGEQFCVGVFKDVDGDGKLAAPYADPHIWMYYSGKMSSRSGAPKF